MNGMEIVSKTWRQTVSAKRGNLPTERRFGGGGGMAAPVVFGYWVWVVCVAWGGAARRMQCGNNLRLLALALQNYADTYAALPEPFTTDAEGRPLHSWRVALLPYIEQSALYTQIRLDEPWDSEWNSRFHDQMPQTFVCPSGEGWTPWGTESRETTYSVVVGEETAFASGKWRKMEEITDGTWDTLAVVERKTPVCWMNPTADLTFKTLLDEAGSEHRGGFQASMLDGSVRFISTKIKPEILRAMATASGGEKY